MQVYALSPCRLPGAMPSGKIDFLAVSAKRGAAPPEAVGHWIAAACEAGEGSTNNALISATQRRGHARTVSLPHVIHPPIGVAGVATRRGW